MAADQSPTPPVPTQGRSSTPVPQRGGRRTARHIHAADQTARIIITIGGVVAIAAVLGIMIFLGAVIVPLFRSPEIGPPAAATLATDPDDVKFIMIDEYLGLAAAVDKRGRLVATPLLEGSGPLEPMQVAAAESPISSHAYNPADGRVVFGYENGSVQTGVVNFAATFRRLDDLPKEAARLTRRERLPLSDGYIERIDDTLFRHIAPRAELAAPVSLDQGSGPVVAVHSFSSDRAELIVSVREDGTLAYSRARITRPLGGGAPRVRLTSTTLPTEPPAGAVGLPSWVFTTSDALSVLLVWKDGIVQRVCVRDNGATLIKGDITHIDERITAASMLLGTRTLMLGTESGAVLGLFTATDYTAGTPDNLALVLAHRIAPPSTDAGAVTEFTISARDRSFAYTTAGGHIAAANMTSHKVFIDQTMPGNRPAMRPVLAPKLDAMAALDETGRLALWTWDSTRNYPEVNLRSLFLPVWYEGESSPSFSYQSSSGEDSAEPKLSITPLVFGTLKATIVAMLFAAPMGILASIYTSEFLHSRTKAVIKPVIETMASLPSVVLGFVAALIVAPVVADVLPAALLGFFSIPVAVLLAAYVWQLAPVRLAARMNDVTHLFTVLGVILLAGGATFFIGPALERALFKPQGPDLVVQAWLVSRAESNLDPAQRRFDPHPNWESLVDSVPPDERPAWIGQRPAMAPNLTRTLRINDGLYFIGSGEVVRPTANDQSPAVTSLVDQGYIGTPDIRLWLDGPVGGPWPGWFLLSVPFGVIVTSLLRSRLVDPLLRGLNWLRFGKTAAFAELGKLIATILVGIGLAASVATLLTTLGIDPRDSIVGTFSVRNSLVVGIIMGFAVIPIIYTISEDAMASVPDSLRSASLGAGATRWQTATRVVLPVAASGIFSACMIGLGRAVGETMIVLMATGNTPTMDLNIFGGFRTLAANIAVELPEAPKDGTLYRVLFLCAFVLLILTFIVNTLAEIVRQRFRKRTAAL